MTDRVEIKYEHIDAALAIIVTKLNHRLSTKGTLSHASNHESLGIITEEYYELIEAVHKKNSDEIKSEAVDVAVAALFAISSMIAKEEIVCCN